MCGSGGTTHLGEVFSMTSRWMPSALQALFHGALAL